MLNETETDEAGAPPVGTTLTPRQVRIVKIAIAVMSVLLIAGFILLLVGIYYRMSELSKPANPAGLAQQRQMGAPLPLLHLPLGPGVKVHDVLVDQGRLIVHLQGGASDELVVIDLATGWQQQRIVLTPQQ